MTNLKVVPRGQSANATSEASTPPAPRPCVIVHGGAGSPPHLSDGCQQAAQAAQRLLDTGQEALAAAVEATRVLEEDGCYNAGIGSHLRLDGKTIEMDAAVMTGAGRFASVIAVRRVRNPVLLARAVLDTPHVCLSGEGALGYARKLGLRTFAKPTERARQRYESALASLRENRAALPAHWRDADLKRLWNFPGKPPIDTVGAVVRDAGGAFAVATSTGGSVPMLRGRVGDTPFIGCGCFAGPYGAVATTGAGEEIIPRVLALRVYDRVAQGEHPQEACQWGARQFPRGSYVGIIAVSRDAYGIASRPGMASWVLT